MKRNLIFMLALLLVLGFPVLHPVLHSLGEGGSFSDGGWILGPQPAFADDPAFTVTVENQLISIQARDASALAVLKDLGEKAGIEVRVYEGVEDKVLNLSIKEHPLSEIARLFQRMNLNYVYGYEVKPSESVVFVLPDAESAGTLAASDKNVPALTTRNGKIYKVETISGNIQVLKEAIDRDWRGEKIEFLDDDGQIIQTRDVFPKDAFGKTVNAVATSPRKQYIAVLNSYSILSASGRETWQDSIYFYDNKGELMWWEIPQIEDQESRFEFTYRYPRDNGTMLEILPFQAEIIQRGIDGEILKKTQLNSWTATPYHDEPPPFSFGISVDYLSSFIAMSRVDGIGVDMGKRYEVYLINADSGEIIWRKEKHVNYGVIQGVYECQGVLIILEIMSESRDEYYQAFDLEGNEIWRQRNEDPHVYSKFVPENEHTLKIIFPKRENKTDTLVIRRSKLMDTKTGKIINDGAN